MDIGYARVSTMSSGHRPRTSAAIRPKSPILRHGLGRRCSANRSLRPNGASMCSRLSCSRHTPMANRGEARECLGGRGKRCIRLTKLALEPKVHTRLIADLHHVPHRLIESRCHSADNRVLGLIGEVGAIKMVVILETVIGSASRQMVQVMLHGYVCRS